MRCDFDMNRYMPELHLFHSENKCRRYLESLGVEYRPMERKDAQTWFLARLGDTRAVVLMQADGDWHSDAALLAHEAVHVAMDVCEELGLEGQESVAYIAGEVSEALFRAHEKWKRRHAGG